jgi:hypothetical protein
MRKTKRIIGCVLGIVFALCTLAGEPSVGVLHADGGAHPGYTLLAPISSATTYLIDLGGVVVHRWESDAPAGNAVYLMENGNLLRTESVAPTGRRKFDRGGAGGRVREIAPDGSVVWEFVLSDGTGRLHHDVEILPDGNILMITWEAKSAAEAIAAGRDPELLLDGELWPDRIIEVEPVRPSGGRIVWEWRVWDHLVQDHDPTKRNYGDVSAHPERIDLNFVSGGGPADWNHTNSVAYSPELDQIVLSVHEFSEIWIIDHSTTTQEAAGRGGDLLFRWGNPQAYRAGAEGGQILYGQHDAQWIAGQLPGAGNLLLFNNGFNRPGKTWSSVVEIEPPIADGEYALGAGAACEPRLPFWRYASADIYSPNISGAQRLPNGNTLICSGASGRLTEVTPDGNAVWIYVNPYTVQNGGKLHREVFKVRRYEADHPGILALLGS